MKLYGLIGYPLGHSFSKQYFSEKFKKENLSDCFFEAFPITSISKFPELLKQNPDLKGLNVTIPYKEQVLDFITELSAEVNQIGASNCVKIQGSKIIGFNTDIIGFEQSFCRMLKPHHNKALVLGTGGSSKAVQYVLHKLEIDFLIVSRTENLKAGFISYDMIDAELMKSYPVIINCTPAGMAPNDHESPLIPYELVSPQHYLYDLVYKPAKTLFLQKGEAKGAFIQNGYEMLLLQAEASWKIWNNQ
jgi:shikimate dehydrogenase